jgi:glycosyltransferase involved in cell wall biosynthesis
MLSKALRSIISQEIFSNWNITIVVANNSLHHEPTKVINEIQKDSNYPIHLINVQTLGIPFARNACCEKALNLKSEWVMFMDDDEEALPGWLKAYDLALQRYQSDVFTGPVEYIFPGKHEKWLANVNKKLGQDGRQLFSAATNNVMFSTKLLTSHPPLRFDTTMALTGGSDSDFFSRYVHQGGKIVAVSNAIVREYVMENRTRLAWRLKRQMQSSSNRVYTSKKLHPKSHILINSSKEVFSRLFNGSIRLLTSPLHLHDGYYAAKRSFYHGLRHYAKAFGVICGLLNKHYHQYKTTDGC